MTSKQIYFFLFLLISYYFNTNFNILFRKNRYQTVKNVQVRAARARISL